MALLSSFILIVKTIDLQSIACACNMECVTVFTISPSMKQYIPQHLVSHDGPLMGNELCLHMLIISRDITFGGRNLDLGKSIVK
jgi:hypothetical protein